MKTPADVEERVEPPRIDCPLCGMTVKQISSATLSLALWQHVNWVCKKSAMVDLLNAARTVIDRGDEEGWLCYNGTDESRLDILEEVVEKYGGKSDANSK